MNGTPSVAGCARSSRKPRGRCGPRRALVAVRIEPRGSIESLACTSRSRPGPPISTIRSRVAVVPPGSSSGAPAANAWQVSRQMPGLGVVVERGQVGLRGRRCRRTASDPGRRSARAAATASRRPRPRPGSGAAPRGPGARGRVVGARPRAVVDVRPGVHDHALGADLDGPPDVVGDRGHRPLVGRGVGDAEVDEVRRVDDHPDPALGASRRGTRRPRPACRRDSAQPRGLPMKTCSASQPPSSRAHGVASTSPGPTLTWVPTGLRSDRSSTGVTYRAGRSDQVDGDRRALGPARPAPGSIEYTKPRPSVAGGLLDVDLEAGVLERARWRRRRRSRARWGPRPARGRAETRS